MQKIQMKTPLVEMDGDEMTRILWKQIKDELILPFVDLKTEYYDLGLVERENTKDAVTHAAAEANKKYGEKKQRLQAYKITLVFNEKSSLYYLNGKSFEVEKQFGKGNNEKN